MQKTILLTGSNGLLGQKIVQNLAGLPHIKLIATSRGVNRHPLRKGYSYRELDLTDHIELAKLYHEVKPQYVIHTAAITQVDYCEDHHEECDAVNIEVVRKLSELSRQYHSRLIHISTDFIFDGENGPYKEEDTPNPVNYYGLSKLKAEEVIQAMEIDYAILRTMLVYGITPAMSRSNIVLWAKKSLESGQTIRVVNDQFRCPTLAEDLASASISAVMHDAQGVYHISGSEMMTIYDMVRQIAAFWKLDPKKVQQTTSDTLNQRAKRPPKTGFILLKAQTELDYRPHTFRQGLALIDRQMREM